MIYAASDFHMGDGGPRDDFTPDCKKRLLSQETSLARHTVVLLGDVVDGHRYGFEASMHVHMDELGMLGRLGAIWIVGNHDEEAWLHQHTLRGLGFTLADRMLLDCPLVDFGTPPALRRWRSMNIAMYLCHGHEFDPYCSGRYAWIGRRASRMANWIGRRSPTWEDRIAGWAGRLQGTGRYAGTPFFDAATKHIEHWPKVGGIICGHTHQAAKARFGDRGPRIDRRKGLLYFNTGMYRKHDWMEIEP